MTRISIRVDGPEAVGEARRRTVAWLGTGDGRSHCLPRRDCGDRVRQQCMEARRLAARFCCPRSIPPARRGRDLALDKGPGIHDIARCFQDGYSTAGSAGTGLGAVHRLSSHYDIHSVPGKGTALLARVWKGDRELPRAPKAHLEVGAVVVPVRGEVVCGDGYAVHQEADFSSIMVVDGLGHGPDAAACADAAKEAFLEIARAEPGRDF